MKKKEIKQLHLKSVKELEQQQDKLRKEIRDATLRVKDEKNTNALRNKEKDLARVITILHEKQFEKNKASEVKGGA